MIFQNKKKRLAKIMQPIAVFCDSSEKDEQTALMLLRDFFVSYKKIKPYKCQYIYRFYYYSYMTNLLLLRRAVTNKNYALACHELYTLYRCDNMLAERVYIGLLLLNKMSMEN